MGGKTKSRVLTGAAVQVLAVLMLASPALGQTQAQPPPPQRRPPAPKPAPKPAAQDAGEGAGEVEELVVTATSPTVYATQPGAALGGLAPELQIGPLDIQSYGVSTVTELLDELAIQTNSSRGRGGETPVVLLNGKRISGMGEVRDIPTEAILRVDILPEETALSYGFTADQKVVNIVLRPRFRALTAEGTVETPTAGGQITGSTDADEFRVRGDNRLNIDVKISGNTDLTAASRGLDAQAGGTPYAILGNVTGLTSRAQLDPALSILAGKPVFVAGVPAIAQSRALTLTDFVSTAGLLNTDNLGQYRDLSAANQNLTANLVAARALGNQWSSTINATFTTSASQSMQGLPNLTLTVPGGAPVSPFSQDVKLYRYLNGLGPLKQDAVNWSGHLGLTINKQAGRWRFSLTGAYDHADSLTETGMGFAAAPMQTLLGAGSASFNPFGPIPASLLVPLPNSEARGITDNGNIQALVNGPLLKVPAGNLNMAFKFGDSQSGSQSASQRLGLVQAVGLSRNDLNGQLNLDLPLTSKRNNVLPQLGELSVNVNANFDRLSDFGTIHSLGYGLNWTPIPQVRLIVSRTRDEAAPSVSQLGAATVITPQVRIFDYATGQTVDVTQISGPNPFLLGDTRNVFKVGVTIRPWTEKQFSINANYVDQRIDNPISTFPSATAQIQAAFPDRFVRDGAGDLIEVDQRPVNFDWTSRRNLRWGFNWSTPFGKPPPRPQRPDGPLPFARRPLGPDGQPLPPRPAGERPAQGQGQQQAQNGQGAAQGGPAPGVAGQALPGGPGQGLGGGGFRAGGAGFGGGPGGGGGFGGGRGGGGGAGGGPGQGRFELAVFDTVYFVDQTLVRSNGPLLDLLTGAPSGKNGGQPLNAIDGQMGVSKNGFGARINATWTQGTTVQGGTLSPSGMLDFSDLTTIHLRMFVNFAQVPGGLARRHPFLRGSRLTLSVFNVFDQHLRVHDATGAVPLGYAPGYLDPTGRQVALSFRKLF
ncbi:MAG: TonB-dependent receptor [Caulobacteraceae bacterium]